MTPADALEGGLDHLVGDIALVEEVLITHLQIDHSGLIDRSLSQCAACRAIDDQHHLLFMRWIEENRDGG